MSWLRSEKGALAGRHLEEPQVAYIVIQHCNESATTYKHLSSSLAITAHYSVKSYLGAVQYIIIWASTEYAKLEFWQAFAH
jgi:hypothetical protein